MSTQSKNINITELLAQVTNQIQSIKANHNGLITVICPTNTSAVFLRRQYESQGSQSFGVRFSTVKEVVQLFDDALGESGIVHSKGSVAHFDECVAIARKLFPSESAWVKAPLISNTLELLATMDDEFYEQALNDYEIVDQCVREFLGNNVFKSTQPVRSIPLDNIVGKCIVAGYETFDRATTRFIKRFENLIDSTLLCNGKNTTSDVIVFEDVYDEIDYVLEQLCSLDTLSLNDCAIVVPDNAHKQLVISAARRKGITLAGMSPSTIGSHPFCEFARHLLSIPNRFIDKEQIQEFGERFPWINLAGGTAIYKCLNEINSSELAGQYFTSIIELITSNLRDNLFDEENQQSFDTQQSQEAYALLLELSTSSAALSKLESLLLLEKMATSKPLRIGALGSGIYLALPNEIFGSSFKYIHICAMNDMYIKPAEIDSSLIPRDQYDRYRISSKVDKDIESQTVLAWLKNCSPSLHMSSSKIQLNGKTRVLPFWVNSMDPPVAPDLLSDFDWDDSLSESIEFMAKLLSSDMNNVNALAKIEQEPTTSATGIEEVASCPSRFFHKRILQETTPLTNNDPDDLLPIVIGSFVHKCLEAFVAEQMTFEDLVQSVDEQIHEMEKTGALPHLASTVMTKQKVSNFLNNFIRLHQESESKEIQVEVSIEKQFEVDDRKINLRGKIDRIQTNEKGVTLVDYKTGKLLKSGDRFHLGRKLQLGIYALMRNEPTDALEYWHLTQDGEIDKVNWDQDAIDDAKKLLESLTQVIHDGIFVARDEHIEIKPKSLRSKSNCDHCDLEPFCYSEHRALWYNHKDSAQLRKYAAAIGEEMLTQDSI